MLATSSNFAEDVAQAHVFYQLSEKCFYPCTQTIRGSNGFMVQI